jgi:hypothetical protein
MLAPQPGRHLGGPPAVATETRRKSGRFTVNTATSFTESENPGNSYGFTMSKISPQSSGADEDSIMQ